MKGTPTMILAFAIPRPNPNEPKTQAGDEGRRLNLPGRREADLSKTPPAYEVFVGNLSGLFSRCITLQHRFVYEVVK